MQSSKTHLCFLEILTLEDLVLTLFCLFRLSFLIVWTDSSSFLELKSSFSSSILVNLEVIFNSYIKWDSLDVKKLETTT